MWTLNGTTIEEVRRWRHSTLWTPGPDDIVSCHRLIIALYDSTLLIVWASATTLLTSTFYFHHYPSGSINTIRLNLSDSDEDAYVERYTDLLPPEEFKPRRIVSEPGLLVAVAEAFSRLHFWTSPFPGVAYTPRPSDGLPCNKTVVEPINRNFKLTFNINRSLFMCVVTKEYSYTIKVILSFEVLNIIPVKRFICVSHVGRN